MITRKESGIGDCLSLAPCDAPIYFVEERAAMNKLLGFDFHQGVLALGRRVEPPTLLEGFENFFLDRRNAERSRAWVVLPDATKPDNLGLAFRCSAALGAEAVVLGEKCCDPFSRRALRVSMGGVLQTPIYRAKDLLSEIAIVRERWGVSFYATVLDDRALSLYDFASSRRDDKYAAFVFGNEYYGLSPEQIAACDKCLTIPMNPDVDSLNLGTSVGIFLYEFNRGRDS
ncbi:MAG: RNA methyltransferase [Thermoguttaceae bacterium]|nr:RNA methyltransferase [Thermoguttaceae bacterium]